MIDLLGFSSAGLNGLKRLQLAGQIRHLPVNPIVRAGSPSIRNDSLGVHFLSSTRRRISDLDVFLNRSASALKQLDHVHSAATSLGSLLSSIQSVALQASSTAISSPVNETTPAMASGTVSINDQMLSTTPTYQAASGSGSVSLGDDAAISVSGTISLLDDAAVDLTGSIQLADDDVASVTGTVNIASSTNLVSDTSISNFETLTVDIDGDVTTIQFGILGDVNTAAELEAALDAIDGLEASYSQDGYLVLNAEDGETSFTIGGSADIQSAFGIAEQAYDPNDLLSQGLTENETLTFQVSGQALQTITFGTGNGQIRTLAGLNAELANLTGFSASIDQSNRLTFAGANAEDNITVGGTAEIAAVFGVAEQTYAPTNLLSQGLSQGETLTFQVGGGDVQTIVFGTGANEVSTLAELETALSGISDLSVSVDGSNRITFGTANAIDTVTVGGTADVQSTFGIAEQTYSPTNLLSQGLFQGETLTFQVGDGEVQTIVFGTGADEVSTLAQFETAVGGLAGVTVSLDNANKLTFIANEPGDTVTVGGTANVSAALGLEKQAYAPAVATPAQLIAGQTLTFKVGEDAVQTIVFGNGEGEVDTVAELKSALSNLVGVNADLDGSGRLSFVAAQDDRTIAVGGTVDVASVFGVSAGTYEPVQHVGTVSDGDLSREEIRSAYNTLVSQIDGIVSGARTGGVNLLAGDEHSVTLGTARGYAYSTNGIRLNASELGLSLVGVTGFDDDAAVQDLLETIDTAIDRVEAAVKIFGHRKAAISTRADFNKSIAALLGDAVAEVEAGRADETDINQLAVETEKQIADLIRSELIGIDDVFRAANPSVEDLEKSVLADLLGESNLAKSLFDSLEDSAGSLLSHTIAFA